MVDNKKKRDISDKPRDIKEIESIEALTQGYRMHLQYEKGMKKGIEAFNLAVENLSPDAIDKIREIIECIADQFSSMPTDEKKSRMDTLDELIEKLASSRDDKVTFKIFKNLSEIPPSTERMTALSWPPYKVFHCY